MRISRNLRNRRLFKEAFKAGYKKALNEARLLKEDAWSDPRYQEMVETVAAAVDEAAEEGVDDVHGIMDYWQQLYADDVLYGDNPLPMNVLVDAFWEGLHRAGIEATAGELSRLLQSYLDLRGDFEDSF